MVRVVPMPENVLPNGTNQKLVHLPVQWNVEWLESTLQNALQAPFVLIKIRSYMFHCKLAGQLSGFVTTHPIGYDHHGRLILTVSGNIKIIFI
jgi:hypothetical protein